MMPTSRTSRVPKQEEMLLSVCGLQLGVLKEDHVETIHGFFTISVPSKFN
ncbi:hypothetical protein M5K25_022767 [Dendrobium thyrsiflorum]|uniref:Uncharacterized protein n=1 Tax=Dendrobium thyrsiflorum TaxID=117978 RepID=A0ABD0U6R2_DENTH